MPHDGDPEHVEFPSPKPSGKVRVPTSPGLPVTAEVVELENLQDQLNDLRAKTARTNDILTSLLDAEAALRTSIFWPTDGTLEVIPAGRTDIDLVSGEITFGALGQTFDLSNTLANVGVDQMRTVRIYPGFSELSVDITPPDELPGVRSAKFFLDQTTNTIKSFPIHELTIHSSLPGNIFIEFGSDPESPPIFPRGAITEMRRRGSLTTTDTLQAVVMRPLKRNVRTQTETIMPVADAQAGALLDAKVVSTVWGARTAWAVRNTGDNDVAINVEGSMRPLSTYFSEDPVTQTGDIIAGGETRFFETSNDYNYERLRARNADTGQPTTIEVDFKMLTGIGR